METQPLYQFLASNIDWGTQANGKWSDVADARIKLGKERLPHWVDDVSLDAGVMYIDVSYQVMTNHGYWAGYINGRVTVSPCLIHGYTVAWYDNGWDNSWVEREESAAFQAWIDEGNDETEYETLHYPYELTVEYILDTIHEEISMEVPRYPDVGQNRL